MVQPQRIQFRTIRLMQHAKDVPLLGEHLSVSYCFEVIDAQSSPKLPVPENQFLEKSDPLMEKFSFCYERIHLHKKITYSRQVLRKSVKKIITKKVGILPLCGFWSDLTKNCIGSFPFPIPLSSFVQNPSSFRGDISENVFHVHYNIRVKPVSLLAYNYHKDSDYLSDRLPSSSITSLHQQETNNTSCINCSKFSSKWSVIHRPLSRCRKHLWLAYEFLRLAIWIAVVYTAAADGCLRRLTRLVHCQLILQLSRRLKLHSVLYISERLID